MNQVRDNVADNLFLTPNNDALLLGLQSYGVWKLNLNELIQTIAIDNVSAPVEAEINETISINITLNHSFIYDSSSDAKRQIIVGLYDSDQGDWINSVSDIVGIESNQNINEESLTYTLELTTPHQAGDYVLEARVYYQKDNEWYYNEHEYLKQFNIKTVHTTEPEPEPSPEPSPSPEPTPEPKPRGIPGFPLESIALGLAIVILAQWIIHRRN
jgi:hypothetical protein